jgi:hypothetical protein
MQEQQYSQAFGISQSALKEWRFKSPLQWKKKWIDKQGDKDEDEDYFIIGSAIDTLLFTPDKFEERFYVSNSNKLPSKAIANVIEATYKILQERKKDNELLPIEKDYSLEANLDILLLCANNYQDYDDNGNLKQGWSTHWKEQTRIDNLIKNGKDYFDFLLSANGRKIITEQQNILALEVIDILRKDESTKDYFVENKNNKLIFQLEIFENYEYTNLTLFNNVCNEIPLKGALDIVRIDHSKKTIQIIDFKTSQSAAHFIESIKKYGYDFQLSFYLYLFQKWAHKNIPNLLSEYRILPPINIVIDFIDKVPYIYEYNNTDLMVARYGNAESFSNLFGQTHPFKIKKGWQQLLNEISWHITTNKWDKTRELYEQNKIKINLQNS